LFGKTTIEKDPTTLAYESVDEGLTSDTTDI